MGYGSEITPTNVIFIIQIYYILAKILENPYRFEKKCIHIFIRDIPKLESWRQITSNTVRFGSIAATRKNSSILM